MILEGIFYASLAGFVGALVLLFYFLAKLRELFAGVSEAVPVVIAAQTANSRALDEINLEISRFKRKVEEMRSVIDERKNLHERQIGEIIRNINSVVARLDGVSPDQLEGIQPNLQALLGELEQLRTPFNPGAKSAK